MGSKSTVIGLMIAILIGGSVYFYRNFLAPAKASEIILDEPVTAVRSGKMLVHVCGEVVCEGVYRVKPGDRIVDAIRLAGGAKAGADLSSLNLAEELKDGQRVEIPRKEYRGVEGLGAMGLRGKESNPGGKISINRASEKELDELPGVGASTAKKIVEARPFSKLEDIIKVPRFGKSKFDKIKDRICL